MFLECLSDKALEELSLDVDKTLHSFRKIGPEQLNQHFFGINRFL